jgi:AAA15 family ATPase/GTPase
MLMSFRVENFRSIRDEAELSFMRSARHKTVRGVSDSWNPNVTTVAAIYGPNASGKSSLLDALKSMARAVTHSAVASKPNSKVPYSPFRLDAENSERPTRYELEFLLRGVRYQYGYTNDDDSYQQEWLYAYPKGRRQTLFERDLEAVDSWYFNKYLGGPNRLIAESTRRNSLYLSVAANLKHPRLTELYDFVETCIHFAGPSDMEERTRQTMKMIEQDPKMADKATALLRHADLGICNIQVNHQEIRAEDREMILRMVEAVHSAVSNDAPMEVANVDGADDLFEGLGTEFVLEHVTETGENVTLPFRHESLGTKSLVSFAGPVLSALAKGFALVVDEVDTSLHPKVVSEIIRLFQSPESNPYQAQLIFSTHDTTLLASLAGEPPALDRDQVWFVEKGIGGNTRLYPLTDYGPRRSESLERGYLQGRYGAIPYVNHRGIVGAFHSDRDPEER